MGPGMYKTILDLIKKGAIGERGRRGIGVGDSPMFRTDLFQMSPEMQEIARRMAKNKSGEEGDTRLGRYRPSPMIPYQEKSVPTHTVSSETLRKSLGDSVSKGEKNAFDLDDDDDPFNSNQLWLAMLGQALTKKKYPSTLPGRGVGERFDWPGYPSSTPLWASDKLHWDIGSKL